MNLKNSARVAVMAVTAAVTANGALAGDAVQWRVADGGNGHWYRNTNVGRSISWGFANDAAEQESGFLVCLEERRESDWVWSNVVLTSPDEPSEYGGWIGLRQIGGPEPLGGWSWISGVPLSYFELAYFDNAYGFGAESYGCYYRTPPYTAGPWADNNFNGCWYQDCVHEYVTEWSADCNSDGIVDYGQCHDGTLPDYNGNNIPDCCDQGVQCIVGNYPAQWRVGNGGMGIGINSFKQQLRGPGNPRGTGRLRSDHISRRSQALRSSPSSSPSRQTFKTNQGDRPGSADIKIELRQTSPSRMGDGAG